MKLRLHHIEVCVKDPSSVVNLLCNQFGLNLVGYRETNKCIQVVLKLAKTVFVITSRKGSVLFEKNNNFEFLKINGTLINGNLPKDPNEYWTGFCCTEDKGEAHVDSVFNVAIEVKNLIESVENARKSGAKVLQNICRVDTGIEGHVDFAVIKSCCGNVVHTLIQKQEFYGWFLPGFNHLNAYTNIVFSDPSAVYNVSHINGITMSHFDHFTLACRVGETNEIIEWYEKVFGMQRFITNRDDTEEDGLVIGNDIGLRLKVMQFWKCSEAGLASQGCNEDNWEPLKIVIAESLPNISNTQIEGFIKDHGGPGIQHLGLHTDNMVDTVRQLSKQGVKFRYPPPTYYTEIGQLNVIKAVGEDVEQLRKYGILLDNEADVFDTDYNPSEERFLMQVFTHPVFDKDTFFLEVIQRRGARGFGVGNVTALARSVNAYNKEMLLLKEKQKKEDESSRINCNNGVNEIDG